MKWSVRVEVLDCGSPCAVPRDNPLPGEMADHYKLPTLTYHATHHLHCCKTHVAIATYFPAPAPSRSHHPPCPTFLPQACHDLVPPDVLAPVIRQLVDQFVHDRARPEVVTIGLKTVRELCTRTPLVMTPELLQVRRSGGGWPSL